MVFLHLVCQIHKQCLPGSEIIMNTVAKIICSLLQIYSIFIPNPQQKQLLKYSIVKVLLPIHMFVLAVVKI